MLAPGPDSNIPVEISLQEPSVPDQIKVPTSRESPWKEVKRNKKKKTKKGSVMVGRAWGVMNGDDYDDDDIDYSDEELDDVDTPVTGDDWRYHPHYHHGIKRSSKPNRALESRMGWGGLDMLSDIVDTKEGSPGLGDRSSNSKGTNADTDTSIFHESLAEPLASFKKNRAENPDPYLNVKVNPDAYPNNKMEPSQRLNGDGPPLHESQQTQPVVPMSPPNQYSQPNPDRPIKEESPGHIVPSMESRIAWGGLNMASRNAFEDPEFWAKDAGDPIQTFDQVGTGVQDDVSGRAGWGGLNLARKTFYPRYEPAPPPPSIWGDFADHVHDQPYIWGGLAMRSDNEPPPVPKITNEPPAPKNRQGQMPKTEDVKLHNGEDKLLAKIHEMRGGNKNNDAPVEEPVITR